MKIGVTGWENYITWSNKRAILKRINHMIEEAASPATAHGLSLTSVKRLLHTVSVRRTSPTRRATKTTPDREHP